MDPPDAAAHKMAVEALMDAQLIVIGPGSLYTSILPNLMVKGIADAVHASQARKVFVTNIATQQGETDGYSVIDHYDALTGHTFPSIADYVIANDNPRELGPEFYGSPVRYHGESLNGASLHLEDLTDDLHPVRHHSEKLASAIMDVYHGDGKPKPLIRLGMS
ncbi:MAG: hypothetical protein F4X34_08705 [Chloroflexi bacterium]|nr:hypothetical protein [Chloroflexota bacterium]